MKLLELKKAIAEAKRFIVTADDAMLASVGDPLYNHQTGRTGGAHIRGQYAAAAKRASMDLTKALAAMRKP